MEGVEERRERLERAVNLGVSRDLPENFTNRRSFGDGIDRKRKEGDEEEEIELSLGLSLNGRFGLDPAAKRLKRSSSVSNLISTVDFFDGGGSSSSSYLARTSSLPAVCDELRRRKELNSLKCMEARKKRMEKLKNGRVVKDKDTSSEDAHTGSGSNDDANEVVLKQASAGSSAGSSSSSSGTSDLQGQILDAGTKTISSNTGSSSHQLPQDEPAQKPPAKVDNKSLKSPLLDMPYVSTRGDGPNSTKIEGFLYRYRKGDEVKIVCVCHGEFLTPAEFVKHGGGGDVAQPLKHIVVNPFPLF